MMTTATRAATQEGAPATATAREAGDAANAALSYTRLDGRVLDLRGLTASERDHLGRSYAAYRRGVPWDAFTRLSVGLENPLVQAAGGRVTRTVWEHPLFQAVRDLEDRLGIAQGRVAPDPGTEAQLARDPLADAWVPAPAAARRQGVSLSGLHKAIARGEVLARPAREGGAWLLVSANSLAQWRPNPARQAAGRRRAESPQPDEGVARSTARSRAGTAARP